MAGDKGFGITTTEIPLLRTDGRKRFERAKPIRVRVLEWTVATLWLSAAGVAIAAIL